ncbi:MAG: efflux RND transporter periplasmic adaptor subunit [Terriglobia bacterium]|nr:MAG: efflux RND transporter periplasmic adaptor subunit [Terriglobia bacterium]
MKHIDETEEQLRAEIESLKHQLEEQRGRHGAPVRSHSRPSRGALVFLGCILLALIVAGFLAGYLPRRKREQVLAAETKTNVESLPLVTVTPVVRGEARSELELPGTIQAVTEAPVLARASGYIRKRYADIGDRVKEGQVLAEIEAPELDQQILQAQATLQQAQNAVQQAEASSQQGRSNENLARITAERWKNLVNRGAVSRQENDVYQAQYAAQQANVQSLEKAVAAANSNVAAAEANVARLRELKGYQTVRAPFAGVVTLRNVDTGALINAGNTLLFRIAQTGTMRTFINVPQAEADSVRVGQPASLDIADMPEHKFSGKVSRTSNALDPASRTLLTEIEVANPEGRLLPGMFTQVDLMVPRRDPPLLIPGDTLVVRADGPQVAVVDSGNEVHYTRIKLGRDYGDRLEVLSGIELGQQLIVNPSDFVREGVKVKPVQQEPSKGRRS